MHFYTQNYKEDNVFRYNVKTKLYTAVTETFIELKNDEDIRFRFDIKRGFTTDGLSVPKMFQWFLPEWDWNNTLYNLAGAVHDACYGAELLSKNVADDMFRGVLRDSGMNRMHASTACWCVNNFAKSHYGIENDRFNCKDYVRLTISD